MEFVPYSLTDFSGGITDNFIGREKTRSQKAHNLLIPVDKKLALRPGSSLDGSNDIQAKIYSGIDHIIAALDTTDKPYKLSTDSDNKGKLFHYRTTNSFTATVTIASPAVFTATSHGLNNSDPIALTTSGALPTGLTANTTYYVINTATNTFQLSATVGGSAINTTGSQSGVHTVNIGHVELFGPTGNSLFTTSHGAATDHRFSQSSWNNHSYITSAAFTEKVNKLYIDNNAVLQLRTAGLPVMTTIANGGSDITATGIGSGAISYLVALVYKYTYIVGNQTFITRSTLFRTTITGAANAPTKITIPVDKKIANSTSDNYDTASTSLVLEYYRSIGNGTEYYLVSGGSTGTYNAGIIQNSNINGTNTIGDGLSDASLILNQVIYSSGGVAENNPPPTAKFMHTSELGYTYYGYCNDGSDTVKARIRQSKIGVPDACPARFFNDLDADVTAISSFRGLPLFFGRQTVYRGDGAFDNFGQGGFTATKISDFAGSVSHLGIVQTYFGCFFPGDSGFYWTNGYQVVKISEELPTSYASAYPTDASKQAIVGTYDEANQLIYWNYVDATNSNACFVLHLRFGIKPDSVFTTIGGNISTTCPDATVYPSAIPTTITQNFRAKSLLYYNRRIYRADSRGYTMYMDSTKKTDPRVDTSTNASSWGTTYLYYDWKSVAMDFENRLVRKWTPSLVATFKNIGNLSAQIKQDRDLKGAFISLKPIKQKSNYSWGDNGILWGDPVIYASESSIYEEKRMLKTPGIRCSYRTIEITNQFSVIQKSDNMGLATLSHGSKTLTLLSGSWPTDILDYYITLASDNYTNHFLITARTSTVLTISDSLGILPADGNYKWEIKGYSKADSIYLESLSLPIAYLTDSQQAYVTGVEGANA